MTHSIRRRSVVRRLGAVTAGLVLSTAAVMGVAGSTATANTAANTAANANAGANAATPAAGVNVAPGSGTLYFDWGCTGSYGSVPIVFNANGSFATGDGNTGLWYRQSGMLTFTFNNFRTAYAMNVSNSVAIGIHSSFQFAPPAGGCSYVVQTGGFAMAPAGLGTEDLDVVGNPVKR